VKVATQRDEGDQRDDRAGQELVPASAGSGLEEVAGGDAAGGMAAFTATMSRSARRAGLGAVASGRWLADTVVELGGHVALRDLATLEAHYDGMSGQALADALVGNACRSTAAIGAAAGAVMSLEELLPPSWIAVPFELLAETAAIAAIEMKLIGELHEAYHRPVPGTPVRRGYALARAWAERRGVTGMALIEGGPAIGDAIGRTARKELMRLVRRRVLRRTGANLAGLGPLLIGGAAGAAINHRSTRKLGETVIDGLQAEAAGR
jgi:hypothetical protein